MALYAKDFPVSRLSDLIQTYLDAHPGMAKQELAKRAGITPQSLSGWASGNTVMKQYPDTEHMKGLAEAMGLSYADILDAITLDLGLPIEREQVRPDVAVTVASLNRLEPQRVKTVAQIIASMMDERD